MKKALKIAGYILLALLLLIVVGALYINISGIPKYPVNLPEFRASMTPDAIDRGEKLASLLCAGCHLDHKSGRLIGKHMVDVPAEFGTIYSKNITADPEFGIGGWTDAEILYLLRTGIKRDGYYAPPYMAKLPKMADQDIDAIISFLRSGRPMVKADKTPDQEPIPSFLSKLLCRVVFKPFPMPTEAIPMPDSLDVLALGQYLAHNLDCYSCHSADFKTNDYLNPEKSAGYFGGGNKPLNEKGREVLTANLTPDPETGIGNWTEEQFIRAVKYGIKGNNEPALQYPMLPHTQLSDHEVGAIYQYLRTIPPIKNKVERSLNL
ncbi:MAG: c-type cytochrome [Saprospiraceae bacterium]|nr:c-type cytochrome [Saprospiraceae bacterium]